MPAERCKKAQIYESAFQSVKLRLWDFRIDTLGFVIHIVHVHISVFQLIFRSQNQIAEEHFQELCCGMNAVLQIVIICSYQSVAEIPGVLFKGIIVYFESECFHVLDHKNSRCFRMKAAAV